VAAVVPDPDRWPGAAPDHADEAHHPLRKLAARVRALSTGHGRKTDEADAVSVGVAAWTATALVSVRFDETALALRALTGHRDDLVKARTQERRCGGGDAALRPAAWCPGCDSAPVGR
jgi:hypothetical protein